MSEGRTGWSKGCLIALAVVGAVVLVCGGFLTWAGYAVWTNPDVQRGVAITGAAMDMAQEGMVAPGADALKSAGCTQPLALTIDAMERFYASAELDAPAPTTPLLVCLMAPDAAPIPTCEELTQTYVGALDTPPREVAARVNVQGEPGPRCQGVYAADGAFVGEMDPMMIRTFGQIGAGPNLGR